jgi:hypothetical protein
MPAAIRHTRQTNTYRATPTLTPAATAILTSGGSLTLGTWLTFDGYAAIPLIALLALLAAASAITGAIWMRDHLHGRIPATRDTTVLHGFGDAIDYAAKAAGIDTPGPVTRPIQIPGLDGQAT